MSTQTEVLECACTSPKLVVEVAGYQYAAVPLDPEAVPSCTCCEGSYSGPWKMGRAVDLRNPDLCGQPKRGGAPCGWVVAESPCPFHQTPEEQEAERVRREDAAEKRRAEIAEDREQRRLGLIDILSVTCPHCGVLAATLCRNPQGRTQRALHKARRQLAGTDWPKEFVLQSSGHRTDVAVEPPLDGDPRAILSDPLTDRTSEASTRFEREQQAEAEKKLHAAKRDVWLATAQHSETVEAVECRRCSAAPGSPCTGGVRRYSKAHAERVDAAMEAEAVTGPAD